MVSNVRGKTNNFNTSQFVLWNADDISITKTLFWPSPIDKLACLLLNRSTPTLVVHCSHRYFWPRYVLADLIYTQSAILFKFSELSHEDWLVFRPKMNSLGQVLSVFS